MIDEGLPEEWPDAVREACTRFKQGDVLSQPPFFYAASAAQAVWNLTKDAGSPEYDEEILQLAEDEAPPYGLITTQTCDIYEEGTPQKPWLQVVPVYDVASGIHPDSIGNLKKGAIGHLVWLDGPDFGAGLWVADLRIEFPLEKSWLVGKEALEGFAREDGYLRLADKLAGRVGRPALHPGLMEVYRQIRQWWKKGATDDARRDVTDVRFAIVVGTRIAPTAVSLLVITDSVAMTDAGRTSWRQCWMRASEAAAERGIALGEIRHETLDSLPSRDFRDSAQLWPF